MDGAGACCQDCINIVAAEGRQHPIIHTTISFVTISSATHQIAITLAEQQSHLSILNPIAWEYQMSRWTTTIKELNRAVLLVSGNFSNS